MTAAAARDEAGAGAAPQALAALCATDDVRSATSCTYDVSRLALDAGAVHALLAALEAFADAEGGEDAATAALDALRQVAKSDDAVKRRRAGGRSARTLDAYFVDGAARYRSHADVARRAFGVETGAAEPPPPVARVEQVESTPRAPEPAAVALGRFEAAAAVRGNDALDAQAAAAEAVLSAVEAGSEDNGARGAALRAFDGGLYRLHVNFSCRVRQRSDAVRRGRDVLTDLRRRCKAPHRPRAQTSRFVPWCGVGSSAPLHHTVAVAP